MWHELFRLRETYLSMKEIKTEVHQEYVRNLFLYETLKLSGNNLPETEFYEMLMNSKRPHTTEGSRAYDLWQAWEFINKKADKHEDLSLDLVRDIAAKVMKHTGREITTTVGRYDSSLGDFRLGEDYNKVYPIADWCQIPALLDTLCRETNVRLHETTGIQNIKLAADFLYEFAHIKPFGEGNIETGLLLMNYLQLYHQEPILILFNEDRSELLNAIKYKDSKQVPEEFEEFIGSQEIKFFRNEIG